MELYIVTRCISDSGKCEVECELFPTEPTAKAAIESGIKNSIQECAEKYGVNPNNIEPKNNQGATVVRMYDGTYTWKVKKFVLPPDLEGNLFVWIHAHNRGYISYAEAQVFTNRDDAVAAMKSSHASSLEMWRLMQGKTMFKSVDQIIGEDYARIQFGGEVEFWKIEKTDIPEVKN